MASGYVLGLVADRLHTSRLRGGSILALRKISSYSGRMPRRRAGELLPLEMAVLAAALTQQRAGRPSFHGFALAQALADRHGGRALTAHGTLYKALGRLEELGLLASQWEDAAAVQGRPRRRLYELTAAGVRAAEAAQSSVDAPAPARRVRPRPRPA
jgi:PadR family transcriptional regulator PadR